MRVRGALAGALLALVARPTAGGDPAADPVAVAAERVLAALGHGDAEALRSLARAGAPDPFAVADALLALALDGRDGALGAARAFAEAASSRPASARLPALVERWERSGSDERARERRVRDARARQRDAMAREARREIVDAARSVSADLARDESVVGWALRVDEHHALVALGRRREAEAAIRDAVRIADAIGWIVAAAGSRNAAGGLAFAAGDVARAREDVSAAIEGYERAGDATGGRAARKNLGALLLKGGRPREALALARRLHDEAEAAGDLRVAASSSALAGAAHRALGDDAAADRAHERAVAEFGRAGEAIWVVRALVNWAAELTDAERLPEAIAVHERTLAALEAHPDDAARATAHANLARLEQMLGNRDRALDHARLAVEAAEAAGDADHLARARLALADALGQVGRHEEALRGTLAWRAHCLETGQSRSAADALANSAQDLAALNRLPEAIEAVTSAMEEFRRLGDRPRLAACLTLRGQLRRLAKDLPGALADLDASTAAHAALGDRSAARAVAHRARGTALLEAGRPADALDDVRAALRILRGLARGIAEDDAFGMRTDLRDAADVGVRAALAVATAGPARLHDAALAAAFDFAEEGRARLLAEGLANADALLAAALPADVLEEEAASRRAVEDARRLAFVASSAGDERSAGAAAQELDAAWRRRDEVAARAARAARRAAAFVAPPPPDLAAVRGALAADEALLLYHLTPFEACAVVVRRGGARLVALGPSPALSQAADAWLRVISAPGASDVEAATRLHALLVRPVEAAIGDARRLLIVPDGILSFVPLEALAVPDGPRTARLVERYETAYLPSAAVLLALRSEVRAAGDRVLAVGDPSPPASGAGLRPLPASAEEARDVVAFVEPGRRSLLLGEDASCARVLEALARGDVRYRVVHFACHAVVDPSRRLGAGLVLAGGEVLGVDRLARLRVSADLATLSACESARGAFARGEGVVGWSRALFLAGVPRVVASAWVVSDRATRPFMRRFYEAHLKEGMPAGRALAEAKRAALRDGGDAASPAHWAAFTLWGLPD